MYIYGIRSPKHVTKVKLDTGAILEVAKYAYAYKPIGMFWACDVKPRWHILAEARLCRMDNIWDKYIKNGGKWPQGGVMVHGDGDDSIPIGASVMTWPQIGGVVPTSIEDCTCNHATVVGKVVEVLS